MATVEELYNALRRSEKLTGGFTARWSAQAIDNGMSSSEAPRAVGIGAVDGNPSLIVVTNLRVIVQRIGPVGGTIDIPLRNISAFSVQGLIGNIKLTGAGYNLEIKSIDRSRADTLVAAVRSGPGRGEAYAQPAAPPPAATHLDPMTKLRELAELRDAGIITTDDFEAKKAELLKLI